MNHVTLAGAARVRRALVAATGLVSMLLAPTAVAQSNECGGYKIEYVFDSTACTLTRRVTPGFSCVDMPGLCTDGCGGSESKQDGVKSYKNMSGEAEVLSCPGHKFSSTCTITYKEPILKQPTAKSQALASLSASGVKVEYSCAWNGSRIDYSIKNRTASSVVVTWDGTPFVNAFLEPNVRAALSVPATSAVADNLRIKVVSATTKHYAMTYATTYVLPSAARFTTYGSGCSGTVGAPRIDNSGVPRIGRSFSLSLSKAPPRAPALLLLGTSRTQWGAVHLPLSLRFIGAPGCSLWTGADWLVPTVADANGGSSVALPVPAQSVFVGAELFAQFAVADPKVNRAGLVFSNAGRGVLGK